MKKVIVTIHTTNDAFHGHPKYETARILRQIADDMDSGRLPKYTYNPVKDINGNTVGSIKVME